MVRVPAQNGQVQCTDPCRLGVAELGLDGTWHSVPVTVVLSLGQLLL